MLRQYSEIKKEYPGTILFFRLGDFYEMFNEDAVLGSRELQITLTARHKDSPNPVPMCGVPHHSAAGYISKLVKKGYRVAICEQAEPATKGIKLVKREVVKVITPGTALDEQLGDAKDSVFLCSVASNGDDFAAAFLELSTGEFSVTHATGVKALETIADQVRRFPVREILADSSSKALISRSIGADENSSQPGFSEVGDNSATPAASGKIVFTPVDDDYFDRSNAERLLKEQFGVRELTAFGIADLSICIAAAGACLRYARETQKANVEHISEITFFRPSEYLVLDAVTLSNLEVLESRSDQQKRTLLGILDETVTGMGGRLLRSWLLRPSIKRSEIETRLSAVDELSDSILRDGIRHLLKGVLDIERLVGRLNLASVSARDLLSLSRSLAQTPEINRLLSDAKSLLLQVLSENIFELPEVRELIDKAISDEPPPNLSDGGTIKRGYNTELDELRHLAGSVKQAIAGFEEQERRETGIGALKVRFNNVFGYYIEVSKANLSKVPPAYERRQTLANAERYTTPQLKEWETKVLGAEEKIIQLENEIFRDVREKVVLSTRQLQSTARALATLDVLAALAEAAARRNFVRPALHDGDEIEIKSGRHPVVEAFLDGSFVPNDIYLNNSTDRLLVLTGANMGGKSTILRQIALIQILAQIGSYVPAAAARLPIVDRIWTRVGASDDLASGRSTFMVEMTETASILHNSTARSLVLLDEIGRGTSTFDGLSIAFAVAEYLHNSPEHSAKSVFATHYHEMTELAENLPGAKNLQITATEKDGNVVFLHKLQPGKASKSYGIAVAKLAGLPQPVIERAKDVLRELEKYELAVFSEEKLNGIGAAAGRSAATQFSLFAIANEDSINELRKLDVDAMGPDEAVQYLRELKQRIN